MSAPAKLNILDLMTVTVPEGRSGNVAVERFEITERDVRFASIRDSVRGYTKPGVYTKLTRNGSLWMSDTRAERMDHVEPLRKAQYSQNRRALVTGLGLGMVIQGLLHTDNIEHVDVVELDADVIALVGPHYEALAAQLGKTITVHHGDARQRVQVLGTKARWGVAWHDIWRDITSENWEEMKRVKRSYSRMVEWQGVWSWEETRECVQREKRYNW